MSKKAIITELRGKGLSVAEAEAQLANVVGAVKTVIDRESRAVIPGWGIFNKKFQAERTTRNPRTGETMTVSARDVVKFKESKPA